MEKYIFKKILKLFSDYSFFAQKGKGDLSTLEAKRNLDLSKFLYAFHSFEVSSYALVDLSELKILKVGDSFMQLTGYQPDYFEGKGFYKFLKVHSLIDIYRSLKGGSQYFKYLYSQEKEKRPHIKANRTLDLYKKNGEIIHVLVQGVPVLFNSKMEVVLMLIICTDITSLKPDNNYSHFIIDTSDPNHIKKIEVNTLVEEPEDSFSPSPAEKKVLHLLSEGYSSKQIAEKLFLSEHTIKNHRKNMLKKFECKTSSGLVKKAILQGWV
jgi:DNA-binding CsgD family transcriptional regulator